MKWFYSLLFVFALSPLSALANTPDMSITAGDLRFSTDTFVAGDTVRIYLRVRNVGDTDISGYVTFYNSSDIIDSSQVVTLVADGAYEEVWVDFVIPHETSFNIRAVIKGTSPQDVDTSNDEILSPLYSILIDEDGDSIDDDTDNCPTTANASQIDTDRDGKGDACDDDDDDDGLDDVVEEEIGTDPQDADSDDDGYDDSEDDNPLNDTIFELIAQEVVMEAPTFFSEPGDEEAVVTSYIGDGQEEDQDEQEMEAGEPDVQETVLQRSSGGILNVSPNASFVFVRDGWKTYSFQSLAYLSTYSSLVWDFGDGSSSTKINVTHEYERPGTYAVHLLLTDANGLSYEDEQQINISFFHLANPFVQIIIGLLFILLLSSFVAILKKPKAKGRMTVVKEDKKPVKKTKTISK